MRVSGAIKSLVHGVTTDNLVNADNRYMAEQINTITRVDEGLTKRPPLEEVASMGVTLAAGDFVKDFIIHDVAYFLVVRAAGLTVYREDGVAFTVTDASAGYLTGVDINSINITVHGEKVYIVNKDIPVEMVSNTDVQVYNSLVVVRTAVPIDTVVKVAVSDSSGIRRTGSITVGATLLSTGSDVVAAQIATLIDGFIGISATSQGSVVETLRTDNNYSEITLECTYGTSDYFIVMNGKVDYFEYLPAFAYHGHITEVSSPGTTEGEPVYMRAVAESYVEQLSTAPGAPAAWPVPTYGDLAFKWRDNAGNINPVDSGNSPGQYYTYLSFYPGPGALIISGNEVFRIDIANYVYATDSVKDYSVVQFLTNPAPTALNIRVAGTTTPNTTIYNHEMSVFGYLWTMDDATVVNESLRDATGTFGVWGGVYEAPASAMAGLIGVRWIEAAAPLLKKTINSATMPHVLAPNGLGGFTYAPAAWDDRRAGNNDSNPLPAFIGKPIEDIVIFQNRLCLLVDDEFVASASGNVLNFFRDTVTQLLSKHPVNLRSTSTASSKLRHFVYHNRDLLITAGRQQYKIAGDIAFTPQTASMQLTTSYNASEQVSPVSIGDAVYIPSHHGTYMHLVKYEGANRNLAADSADSITQHVRKYISGTVDILKGLPNHGLLLAAATDGQTVFVCNYDTNKSRAEDKRFAWFKWNDFSDDVAYTISAMSTSKNTVLLAINTTQGLTMLKMDIDSGSEHIYLDYQKAFTAVNTTVDVTTAYGISLADITVVQGIGCPAPGDIVGTVSLVAGVLTLDTDMVGGAVTVGREFNSWVVPNLVTIRDEGGHVNNAANLRIRRFEARVFNTGLMTALERSPYDTYETQEFTGLVSGSLDAITDQEATTTDIFKVGFKQHADVGTVLFGSKSWLPMTITQIDWVGNYKSRGRRF